MSTKNTEFTFVLLFLIIVFFMGATVNLLLPHPVSRAFSKDQRIKLSKRNRCSALTSVLLLAFHSPPFLFQGKPGSSSWTSPKAAVGSGVTHLCAFNSVDSFN